MQKEDIIGIIGRVIIREYFLMGEIIKDKKINLMTMVMMLVFDFKDIGILFMKLISIEKYRLTRINGNIG